VNVTVVEGGELSKVQGWDMPPYAFSNRVVSLTNASLDFLDGVSCPLFQPSCGLIIPEIGAWKHVDVKRTAPIEHMQVLSCLYSLSPTVYDLSGLGWHL
jgi:ubiquinone biosynthesis monooxygenase Coq6